MHLPLQACYPFALSLKRYTTAVDMKGHAPFNGQLSVLVGEREAGRQGQAGQ